MNSKKLSKGGGSALLLAGAAAAFAYYKYSKMSDEQKNNLVGDLKEKGKKLYEQYVPQDIKDMLTKTTGDSTHQQTAGSTEFNG